MMRILTPQRVDVTDDHSLIRSDGVEISPNECEIGTELLHHTCEDNFKNEVPNSTSEEIDFDYLFQIITLKWRNTFIINTM